MKLINRWIPIRENGKMKFQTKVKKRHEMEEIFAFKVKMI